MVLDEHIFNLESYLYMERYINDGSPSGFSIKKTSSFPTKADSINKNFYLTNLIFPDETKVYEFGVKPSFADTWQMLVHPDMIYNAKMNPLFSCCTDIDLYSVLVEPTASVRSVKALGTDWFIKLHYDGLIGRIDRKIERNNAMSAVEVSNIMETAINEHRLPRKFYILKEPFARTIDLYDNEMKLHEWGIVLRESIPYPRNEQIKFLIPAFSLFSKDHKNPDDKSILTQLIQKQNKEVNNFIWEDLVKPIFESYFELIINCGLLLECHAQNTLFAIDEDFKILGIVIKDAESIDKDISLIEELNIKLNITTDSYKCMRKDDDNYIKKHSFMFDFKLGEYLISPILEDVSQNFPSFDKKSVISIVRKYNQNYIERLPPGYFPLDVWYSDKKVIRDRTQKKEYIENINPKFR